MRESNPHQKFWRLLSYHLTNPLYTIKRGVFTQLNSLSLIKIREPPRTKFMLRLQLAFIKLLSAYLQNHTQVNLFSYIISSFSIPITFGYALDRLVTVSCMHYCTSTSVLSTLSSSRGLTNLTLWDISS